MTIFDLKNGFQYAMHGLGAYKGLRQTNTLEAFEYWYKKGVRVFEIDIAKTEDTQYVAVAHSVNRQSMKRLEIADVPSAYTYEWFMKQRLFLYTTNGLTPLSIGNIVALLNKYHDCVFMLDLFGMFTEDEVECFLNTLDNCSNIKPCLQNLLLEVYNQIMVKTIRKHSSEYNIIYCARYEGNMGCDRVTNEYLVNNGIQFISYPWIHTTMFTEELKKYASHSLTIFSRTKYNMQKDRLIECGVSVNIVAYRFDKYLMPIQYIMYFLECLKRLVVKIGMKAGVI